MRFYSVVRANAHEFADERNTEVYICKANKLQKFCINFSKDTITPNYHLYAVVKPDTENEEFIWDD